MNIVKFKETELEVIEHKSKPYLPARQIGIALGYSDSNKIINLYNRNKSEFSDDMTAILKMRTPSGEQMCRVFSPRGCHLIGMFAKTSIAKDFRKWVLDVLDKQINPIIEPTPTVDMKAIGGLVKRCVGKVLDDKLSKARLMPKGIIVYEDYCFEEHIETAVKKVFNEKYEQSFMHGFKHNIAEIIKEVSNQSEKEQKEQINIVLPDDLLKDEITPRKIVEIVRSMKNMIEPKQMDNNYRKLYRLFTAIINTFATYYSIQSEGLFALEFNKSNLKKKELENLQYLFRNVSGQPVKLQNY